MNAVERVRESKIGMWFKHDEYREGFFNALDDVQAELDKEVSCDWEAEIKQLNDKHRCEIEELKSKIMDKDFVIETMERTCVQNLEHAKMKAKLEIVELIFGGK